MDKLSSLPSQGAVRYTSDFNPALGETLDPRVHSIRWHRQVADTAAGTGAEIVRHRSGTVTFEGSSTFVLTSTDGSYRCSLVDGSLVR